MVEGAGEGHATARVDAFVDASFAFAVTLLVIGGGSGPPQTLDQLRDALWGIPAFAAGFALIGFFWASHREFGRLSPVRDPLSVTLSLAVVFTVLVYVYPLRLLMSSFAAWVSGGRTGGRGLMDSWDDLQTLYIVYGLGYAVLAGLYASLFSHGRKLRGEAPPEKGRSLDDWIWVWRATFCIGLLSILTAVVVPIRVAPWAPGMVYCLIPAAIYGRLALEKHQARRAVGASRAEATPPI